MVSTESVRDVTRPRIWLGPALAIPALALLWQGSLEEKVLNAMPNPTTEDIDQDGLIQHQEELLGSLDNQQDTDSDGFVDLVELARGSDLTNAVSQPAPQILSVGMASRTDEGLVTIVSAIYSTFSELPDLDFRLGVSIDGTPIELPPSIFLPSSALSLYPAFDANGIIILLETSFPQSLLTQFGYLGFYSTIAPQGGLPLGAAVLNLFDFDGYAVEMVPAPMEFAAGGSIYKPLGRGEDLPASVWTDGQVCWQATSTVGSQGGSVVLEVEDASCVPMTTMCHSTACQATIGSQITILDAGSFTGGS